MLAIDSMAVDEATLRRRRFVSCLLCLGDSVEVGPPYQVCTYLRYLDYLVSSDVEVPNGTYLMWVTWDVCT